MRLLRQCPVWAAILATAPAFAGFLSTETYLPAVGRTPGQGGAQFYTTVWATNLTGATVHFTFDFLKQGQANPSPTSFADTLSPGQTKVYENVVETKLGLSSAIGAARVVSDGELLVSERIYDQAPGADVGNTEGLFFAGVPKTFSISPGQSASIQGVNQGGAENFRYNFALVETGGGSPTVNVQLFDGIGTLLGQKAYVLQPYEQIQPNVADLASPVSTTNARITATVTGGTGSALIAGAQLANESQDSSGFEMSFRDDLLGGGGTAGVTSLNGLTGALTIAHGANTTVNVNGSTITIDAVSGSGNGLTAVAHDNSLAGSGTASVPLAIASGQVVRSLTAGGATLHDAVTLAAGSNVTLTPSGSTITIAAAGGSGGGGLASVSTDSTLKGNGTGAAPLGISVPLVLSGGSGNTISGTYTGGVGSNAGVFGSSASTTGFGVQGSNTHSGNNGYLGGPDYGVFGNSVNGAHGIIGASVGGGHAGVYGTNSSGSGYGVNGFHSGSGNNGYLGGPDYGVFGTASSSPGVIGSSAGGLIAGVKGQTSNSNGWGVEGINPTSTNYGLLGGPGFGVEGVNNLSSGFAVEGLDLSGSTSAYGVYGSSANGFAGYFSGAVKMTNNLWVVGDVLVQGSFNAAGSVKNFVSPDPSDPARQIVYTCLEGPESGTYFRGSGTIAGGFATIEVPESFRLVSSPNGITVVATAVGSPASLTVVRKSLDRIVIQGSADVDFDFMVNGVRAGFEDHRTFEPNRFYVPTSVAGDNLRGLSAGTIAMLKKNRILNADGSVNLETASRMGWDRRESWKSAEEEANRR